MNVSIRPAKITDAPAMAKVMVDTWLKTHRGQVPEAQWQKRKETWTYDVSEQGWRRLLIAMDADEASATCIYVAVNSMDDVIGLIVGRSSQLSFLVNAAEISVIYISCSYQAKGIGRRLIQKAVDYQIARGKSALLISVLATNTPACRFYEALGGQRLAAHETEDDGFKEPQIIYGWHDIYALAKLTTRSK